MIADHWGKRLDRSDTVHAVSIEPSTNSRAQRRVSDAVQRTRSIEDRLRSNYSMTKWEPKSVPIRFASYQAENSPNA